MTRVAAVAEGTIWLEPSRDERLIPYCLIAFGGLLVALIAGLPALAALSAPFALALVVGLRRTGAVAVAARVRLDADQVLDGDRVTGRIELSWDGTFDAQVMLHRLKGTPVTSDSAAPSWSRAGASGTIELPIEFDATQWGRHTVGEVWVKLALPLGLLTWTGPVAIGPTLRVLPTAERLNRLLDPTESRAVLGTHRSRRRGDGHEFAELRPYMSGDRLRDLNWGATARHRRPFVNRHHPEMSGDVVIAIDAFVDGSGGSTVALARAARAAWALVSVHLQANDRVGLAGLGGGTQWLPPAGGRRAKYQLLETLLRVGGEAADRRSYPGRVRIAVPPSALVVALTPLHDERMLTTLQGWRARGRAVAAIVVDTLDLLGEPGSVADSLARRVWALERERRKRDLMRLGIPVVTTTGEGPVSSAVVALRRSRRMPAAGTGR